MSYMKDWNENLLLLMVDTTQDERKQKYIRTILLERFNGAVDVFGLYKKLKNRQGKSSDIIWNAIACALSRESFIVEVSMVEQILQEMPMEYLAIVSTTCRNQYISARAKVICAGKQEEYEKEIGIYDDTYIKYQMDEEILRMEKRRMK